MIQPFSALEMIEYPRCKQYTIQSLPAQCHAVSNCAFSDAHKKSTVLPEPILTKLRNAKQQNVRITAQFRLYLTATCTVGTDIRIRSQLKAAFHCVEFNKTHNCSKASCGDSAFGIAANRSAKMGRGEEIHFRLKSVTEHTGSKLVLKRYIFVKRQRISRKSKHSSVADTRSQTERWTKSPHKAFFRLLRKECLSPTFCPHSVSTCFITEADCVYCAVRTNLYT